MTVSRCLRTFSETVKISRKNDKIGMLAEENPELPYEFIKETLEAIEEEKRACWYRIK